MRKIEQAMCRAILTGTDWKLDNTEVRHLKDGSDGFNPTCLVYLHGHLIAERQLSDGTWRYNLCGWNTPTTRSRINTIMHRCDSWARANTMGITTRQGQASIHSRQSVKARYKAIDNHEWFSAASLPAVAS